MAGYLELRNVGKRYAGFELGPLNLSFAPGRVHGLLGPNGAGKTTLLSVVTLQAKATSGTMLHDGEPVTWGDARWKERVAYVRETPSFYSELTVTETMRFASRLYGRWDAAVASQMIARLGLPAGQRVGTLSKGTRVKLGIAAALAQRAELLILDEPTAGVDPTAREELYAILRDLRADRPELSIILSSHIFEDLEASADDLLILRHGHVVFQSTQEKLRGMSLYRLPSDLDVSYPDDVPLAWTSNGQKWVMTEAASATGHRLRATPGCVEESRGSVLAAVYRGTGQLARQEIK